MLCLVIAALFTSISEADRKVILAPAPAPIRARIVDVYQHNGQMWTSLAWGDGERGAWISKLGEIGDTVLIYKTGPNRHALTP